MEACGDEKWKLSKKGRSRSGRAAAAPSSSDGALLSRSYSASVSATRDYHHPPPPAPQQQQGASASRLSKKCVDAVKEQRARFYIVRRCVSMLVCWRDY